MKIILSPAKKMNCDTDTLDALGLPEFLHETEEILTWLKAKSESELKALWKCNDKILEENMERLERLKSQQDLRKNLTPAVIAYDGIAYQYMAPAVFENEQLNYVQEHLRILSAFYGVLKAMDGVVPYRLEMQAKVDVAEGRNLYEFWGDKIYKAVRDESGIIINLASKEYFKCVEKYLRPEDRFITITFVEMAKDKDGNDVHVPFSFGDTTPPLFLHHGFWYTDIPYESTSPDCILIDEKEFFRRRMAFTNEQDYS